MAETASTKDQNTRVTAWSPLRYNLFRILFIATIASNIGTWFQEVGAAWLMTSLSPSPLMVTLVQTANTLPVLLFALPAGALADIFDRKQLLLFATIWLGLSALLLGITTLVGATSSVVLLLFIFVFGIGTALTQPAWQAIVPELVPREHLQSAVTLNSAGINVSRAIGPALGGIIISTFGVIPAFFLNALSYLGILIALFMWKRKPDEHTLPNETLGKSVLLGTQYVKNTPALRNIFIRTGLFVIFASSIWALLPIMARSTLDVGAQGYGLMLTAIGLGALTGTTILPRFRRYLQTDQLVLVSCLLYGAMLVIIALTTNFILVCATLFIVGVAWLTLLSTFQAGAQLVVPSWVRGRAMAVYFMVFFGGMAAGGIVWGIVAESTSIVLTLLITAGGLGLSIVWRFLFPLGEFERLDKSPSPFIPEHRLEDVPENEWHDLPVQVVIEYKVKAEQQVAFLRVLQELSQERRRVGAIAWQVFRRIPDDGLIIEQFTVPSWVEHLRQHQRETMDDHKVHLRANAFHVGEEPPLVTHYIIKRDI